ncbi:MAG: ferredoxin [Rhizobiaceae bacterium]|nr:ferredoxin [Rhizobiaceae bacterium]
MAVSPIEPAQLDQALAALGLHNFGYFTFEEHHLRPGSEALFGACGIVIGNAGPEMWRVFSVSAEFGDGLPNPMNRWTRRVLEEAALNFCDFCIFPFDEPYWPFQRFLSSASHIGQSPLGLYIHPEFGLWHALRGVLVFEDRQRFDSLFNTKGFDVKELIQHPCDTCADKPCLSACPVGAFNGTALDVKSCFEHLDADHDPKCMTLGCRARHACPVGNEYRYDAEQIRFHMRSYRY